ncbi:hypothetical protein Plhal304r1_c101g0174991 [Plasmopara halstedii]
MYFSHLCKCVKIYRVFDLEDVKILELRFVGLDEREIDDVFDSHTLQPDTSIQFIKDIDDGYVQNQVNH